MALAQMPATKDDPDLLLQIRIIRELLEGCPRASVAQPL